MLHLEGGFSLITLDCSELLNNITSVILLVPYSCLTETQRQLVAVIQFLLFTKSRETKSFILIL